MIRHLEAIMKKKMFFLILFVPVVAAPTLFAEKWDSVYENYDLSLSAGVGFISPLGVAGYPGAELILAQFKVAEEVPMDIGVAVRGQVGVNTRVTASETTYGYNTYGGGAFGTLHLSFGDIEGYELDFLKSFDFYASVGIAFNYFNLYGIWPSPPPSKFSLNFATFEGINWFLTKRLALKLEFLYWGDTGASAVLGVQYTL